GYTATGGPGRPGQPDGAVAVGGSDLQEVSALAASDQDADQVGCVRFQVQHLLAVVWLTLIVLAAKRLQFVEQTPNFRFHTQYLPRWMRRRGKGLSQQRVSLNPVARRCVLADALPAVIAFGQGKYLAAEGGDEVLAGLGHILVVAIQIAARLVDVSRIQRKFGRCGPAQLFFQPRRVPPQLAKAAPRLVQVGGWWVQVGVKLRLAIH